MFTNEGTKVISSLAVKHYNMNYQNLVIIGNGFDLNLGLKTSYHDFITSPENHTNIMRGNEMAQQIKSRFTAANWIDIENELKKYSKNYPDYERMRKMFSDLKDALCTYIQGIDVSKINFNTPAFRLINNIVRTECKILDFNYTDTLQYIFKNLEMPVHEFDLKVQKVHGSATQGNIIFGLEDSAEVVKYHTFLKKSTNDNFQGIEISDFIKSITHVHIFGHSLGETDRTYFEPYFQKVTNGAVPANKSHVTLYYYGQKSKDDLMMQISIMTGHKINEFKKRVYLEMIDTSKLDA